MGDDTSPQVEHSYSEYKARGCANHHPFGSSDSPQGENTVTSQHTLARGSPNDPEFGRNGLGKLLDQENPSSITNCLQWRVITQAENNTHGQFVGQDDGELLEDDARDDARDDAKAGTRIPEDPSQIDSEEP